MTSTGSSSGVPNRPELRPSFSSRLSIPVSIRSGNSIELGNPEVPEEHLEEIEAIKRYEDFTTIGAQLSQDSRKRLMRRDNHRLGARRRAGAAAETDTKTAQGEWILGAGEDTWLAAEAGGFV